MVALTAARVMRKASAVALASITPTDAKLITHRTSSGIADLLAPRPAKPGKRVTGVACDATPEREEVSEVLRFRKRVSRHAS
jgi:hypothetical protein